MLQQQPPLIVKISWSLSTAIFDCRICTNWQTNVYLTSSVRLNLVKFHRGTSTQKFRRVQHQRARPYTCYLTPTWETYRDKMCV